MKRCDDCKHAEWKRTATGRLHPDKTGHCAKAREWVCPPIPACCHWIGSGAPKPYGGLIERGRDLSEHCPFWERWVKDEVAA